MEWRELRGRGARRAKAALGKGPLGWVRVVPTPYGGYARPGQPKRPAGAGNRGNEPGTETPQGRNRVRGRMTGYKPEAERKGRGL